MERPDRDESQQEDANREAGGTKPQTDSPADGPSRGEEGQGSDLGATSQDQPQPS